MIPSRQFVKSFTRSERQGDLAGETRVESHGNDPRYTLPAMAGPGNENPWAGLGIGWAIIATLIAGMLVWGGLGYLVDRLVGTSHVFMAIGTVVGAAGGIYVVYLRFGREPRAKG
jgi:ATP synthase protein I